MYEVRDCLQTLVDQVVKMVEEDDTPVDISLRTDDVSDLVDVHGAPIDTARHLNLTLNLTIHTQSRTHLHWFIADGLSP